MATQYEHLKCPECGKDFKISKSYFKERMKKSKSKNLYCSSLCSGYSRINKKKKEKKV